mgnify:CR=1 FL=1
MGKKGNVDHKITGGLIVILILSLFLFVPFALVPSILLVTTKPTHVAEYTARLDLESEKLVFDCGTYKQEVPLDEDTFVLCNRYPVEVKKVDVCNGFALVVVSKRVPFIKQLLAKLNIAPSSVTTVSP